MERRRRTGWTGGQRPQHASAHSASQALPVTFTALPSALLPVSRLPSSVKITPSTPLKTTELNRQTRVFGNAVTPTKQRTASRSNPPKNQIWTSDNLGPVSTKASAFRNVFFAFLPGSAQQVECAVTHSKQSTATFLPGSRIALWRTIISTPTTQKLAQVKLRNRYDIHRSNTFLPGSAQQVEFAVTRSKQSTATFLPGSRIASLAHSKSSNIISKLSEERAWLRL
jgi:hypothetical protein